MAEVRIFTMLAWCIFYDPQFHNILSYRIFQQSQVPSRRLQCQTRRIYSAVKFVDDFQTRLTIFIHGRTTNSSTLTKLNSWLLILGKDKAKTHPSLHELRCGAAFNCFWVTGNQHHRQPVMYIIHLHPGKDRPKTSTTNTTLKNKIKGTLFIWFLSIMV